jgi:hypothetical protein
MAASIPELSPKRFDVEDKAGLRAHLIEHGCETPDYSTQ